MSADEDVVGYYAEDVQRKLRNPQYSAINEVFGDLSAMSSPEHREAALVWLVMNLGYMVSTMESRLADLHEMVDRLLARE